MSFKKTFLAGAITIACSALIITTMAQAYVTDATETYATVNNLMTLDSKPSNDKICHVRDNTGTDDQGRLCVCSDDPDGDPYMVWVCK